MTKTILIACCVLSALLLLACTKSETTPTANTSTAPANRPVAAASTPAAATTAPAGDKIGVAECDAYITAYEACVTNKVPETARAQFNSSLAQVRTQWRQLASNPQTKPTLAAACKTAMESAKTSMKAYGCTF
jgi:hypothetical protein